MSDLDALPIPDHDDYFKTIGRLPEADRLLLGKALPAESSRGCWWGDKRACTFCGLNRGSHGYRSKRPERVEEELAALAARYSMREFVMTDNAMPPNYLATLFPQLEGRRAPYGLFYEIRPTLRREQVRQLSAAGVRHVQVGIESLHDGLLSLMNKGTTILQNVALLKHAHEFGVTVGWHLLTGLPGSADEWYGAMAEWLPLVHHLQPPTSVHGVTLQRFSVYLEEPARFGLDPMPYNNYEVVYPFPPETVRGLAYYFRDASWPESFPEMNRETPGVTSLLAAVDAWRRACRGPNPAALTVRELGAGSLGFVDTRSCAVSREVVLRGVPAQAYRLADDGVDLEALSSRLATLGVSCSPAEMREAVAEIVGARLALLRSDRLLSLAKPASGAMAGVSPAKRDAAETAFRRYLSELARQPE